ncbi:MAG: protein kinase, partial [Gammaproteobacteria bacterium]|nr:protein kinase [Gammaproteobacteria bacterium]
MGTNTLTLINHLQNGMPLEGRFSNIRVVNRDPTTGERGTEDQGALSVIFQAIDEATQKEVALKFFDPDFLGFNTRYRMELFEREAKLLGQFVDKPRFLQRIQPLSEIEISATEANGNSITVRCAYFVIEWLDGDITKYFLRQNEYDALVKLSLFRQIVLGVISLHSEKVAHRDIKRDNLRQTVRNNREMTIAIDFGTAIQLDSTPIGTISNYSSAVGATMFAPIEARVGLSGIREVAIYSDIYALGCILHDLFNIEYFTVRLFNDAGYVNCLGKCSSHISKINLREVSDEVIIKEFERILNLTRNQVVLPGIDSADTSVPNAARDQLSRLLHKLTNIDYKHREHNLQEILKMIDSATRSIQNELMDRRKLDQRRKKREQSKLK